MDRYQKSFRTPEPTPNALTIGVSGSQSSGGRNSKGDVN